MPSARTASKCYPDPQSDISFIQYVHPKCAARTLNGGGASGHNNSGSKHIRWKQYFSRMTLPCSGGVCARQTVECQRFLLLAGVHDYHNVTSVQRQRDWHHRKNFVLPRSSRKCVVSSPPHHYSG